MHYISSTHQSISQMCAQLGRDALLVHGAGGNVSWKEDEILWVKGSGTWLSNANNEDIFVPVNLGHLQDALAKQDFDMKPQLIGEHTLRPSIETALHALMPNKIVVHLHAINALSHLVIQDCNQSIQKICQQASINGAYIGYHKPGPDLARAIFRSLRSSPEVNVLFLQNHGIIIGANSIAEIYSLLRVIDTAFVSKEISTKVNTPLTSLYSPIPDYSPIMDSEVQSLSFNPELFKRLQQDWVLFPDHAVFLGPKANTYLSWAHFQNQNTNEAPELIFIENGGVFAKTEFNKAKIAQLRCYYDVISRVGHEARLMPLSETDIHELLNWDAEKLRQQMSRK